MQTIYLGPGDNEFVRTRASADFASGDALYGNNGDDSITLGDGAPGPHGFSFSDLYIDGGNGDDGVLLFGHHSSLYGRNGNDTLSVSGTDNWIRGGRGDDVLAATISNGAVGNHVFGGPGDDYLSSSTPPVSGLVSNNELSGGPGQDSFNFNSPINFSSVNVVNKSGGTVIAGDIIRGNFNLVIDYEAGEQLFLGATTPVEGEVTLNASGIPLIPDGAYAVFRGDFEAVREFAVDPDGDDLLVIFDRLNGQDSTSHGSVVLQGFTDAGALLIA